MSKDGWYVMFGDNNKGKITGEGNIGNQHKTQIKNVLHMDALKHNLLNISQLWAYFYHLWVYKAILDMDNVVYKL